MEKTPQSLAEEIVSMKQSLAQISAEIDSFAEAATRNLDSTSPTALGEVTEKRAALYVTSSQLWSTIRGPTQMVFANFEHVS
jgi:hypothetical protein